MKSRKNCCLAAVFVLALIYLGCGDDQTEPEVEPSPGDIVRVGDIVLNRSDLNDLLPANHNAEFNEREKRDYLARWVDIELLYQEAMERGLKEDPRIRERIRKLEKEFLADHLLFLEMRERVRVTDREIEQYFEEHRREYTREYRVRHILLNSREKAEEVRNMIGSRSFSYLANRYSADPDAGRGGDLGYLTRGNMIPELEEAVFSLEPGQVSGIIKSRFGYHILKLVGSREALGTIHMEDVQGEIMNHLIMKKREQAYEEFLQYLREKIGVAYYNEAYQPEDTLREAEGENNE
ncbi:MAG: peptidylprolyl isomerase [Candidatus Krumholzibacteriales bacterium]